MERLSALTGVKRAEVTKAMKLRADKISGRLNKVEDVDEQAVAVEA
jgi:hypothetical protein